jgi:thiol-disulfide isomerase/thioredoxin
MKMLGVLGMLVSLTASSLASQRVVVAEDFTGTWCQYCPGAARGLDQLYNETADSLVVLAYHSGDPYQTTETYNRIIFYGDMIPGFPAVILDGVDTIIGGTNAGTMYDYYRPVFDVHKTVPSPFEMTLVMSTHDLSARTGTVDVKIRNTNSVSESGTLHFVVLERNIPVSWQGMDEVDFVVRDMVPDENGAAINIPAGDSLVITRDFTIAPAWKLGSCQFVAFIQRSNKEIIQGSQLYGPFLAQQSYGLAEIGDGDGYYEPGESLHLSVEVKDRYAPGTGAVVEATSADTFVTINIGLWDIGNMLANEILDNSASPFEVLIKSSATMPEGHRVNIVVTKKIFSTLYYDTILACDTIKFTIGSPNTIYFEDFESGLGSWTTSYVGNASKWDTTGSDYHSSNQCITDSKSGSYVTSSINRIQMTTGIDLSSYSYATLSLWEKYFTDETGDECRIKYSTDGGTAWSDLVKYSDTCSVWIKRTTEITPFCGTAGDFRIRFEFFSNSSITADGWYVDDVMILGYTKTGVSSDGRPLSPIIGMKLEQNYPNPFNRNTSIRFALSASCPVKLNVYDITGRLVRNMVEGILESGSYSIVWDGRDNNGRRMGNGVYFYRLDAGGGQKTMKAVLVQ